MRAVALMLMLGTVVIANAEYELDYNVSLVANAGSGDFAPTYMSSNVHGVLTQPYSTMLRASVSREMDYDKRFSYGFGVDVIGGYSSKTDYLRYDGNDALWHGHSEGPAPVWLQQLYGELKYRGVYFTFGMKEWGSVLLNNSLSSGDLTFSGNSRPIPEVRIGFFDFEDIPFTRGWVQIRGAFSYGINMDGEWLEHHYNYNSSFINTNSWYNYKFVHFRTNPEKPFSFLVGMQAACQFGGTYKEYVNGNLTNTEEGKLRVKDFFYALIPMQQSGSAYYEGNHIGSWDVMGRYRLKDGKEIKAYYQSLWEDGSGIGKLNGFDGLYGLEFKNDKEGIVDGVVLEYIDFTNQSGPLHWAPGDFDDGHLIPTPATGADDYYNNFFYNGYTRYGMSIGSPFIKSIIYNTDGYMRITDNRIRGFHLGVSGHLFSGFSYRLLASYRKSWGSSMVPSIEKTHTTSMLLEGIYEFKGIPGLQVKGQFAFDSGSLYGDNMGALVSISYRGLLKL